MRINLASTKEHRLRLLSSESKISEEKSCTDERRGEKRKERESCEIRSAASLLLLLPQSQP
jgi:hypothetical protein